VTLDADAWTRLCEDFNVVAGAGWMIMQADSVAHVMPAMIVCGFEVDHVIGDPPYDPKTHNGARNAAASKSKTRTTGRDGERPNMLPIDFEPLEAGDVARIVSSWMTVARRWCIGFCALEMLGEYRDAAGERWIRAGVFHRTDSTPQFSGDRPGQGCEGVPIWHRNGRKRWNGGGMPASWSFPIERNDRVHPTQKPIGLMMKLVEQFTDPGDVVLDPFCGSGTTGIACLRLGRRFIGIERDPKYAALARERLSAESAGGLSLTAARAGQVSLL
jgi:site-specific DNA-methyltransferase (adenine-specific)